MNLQEDGSSTSSEMDLNGEKSFVVYKIKKNEFQNENLSVANSDFQTTYHRSRKSPHNNNNARTPVRLNSGTEWQKSKISPMQRLSYLITNETFGDLKVLFDNGKYVKVHKLILAMHSPVFEANFYGSIPHTSPQMTLHNVNWKVFKWIIDYMYLGRKTITDVKLAVEIFVFAHEKQMNLVVARCSKFLSTHVSADDVMSVLQIASLYEDNVLKKACCMIIFEKRASMFTSDDIGDMPKNVLIDLINSDKIKYTEKAIFKTILKWSRIQLTKRNELITTMALRKEIADFLPFIRFSMMKSDTFIADVLSTGIFIPEEGLAILKKLKISENTSTYLSSRSSRYYANEDVNIMHILTIIKEPLCNTSFIYNHMHETFTDKFIVFKCSEDVHLSAIKVKPSCYIGSWRICITDSVDNEIGKSTHDGPPWNFNRLIPIAADTCYVGKIQGKGKRCKHQIVEYESFTDGISFSGIAVACNVSIIYWT